MPLLAPTGRRHVAAGEPRPPVHIILPVRERVVVHTQPLGDQGKGQPPNHDLISRGLLEITGTDSLARADVL